MAMQLSMENRIHSSLSHDQKNPPVFKIDIVLGLELLLDTHLLSSILGSEKLILEINIISSIYYGQLYESSISFHFSTFELSILIIKI